MNKLGMSVMISHPDNPSIEKQIPLFAQEGFDSFFLSCGVTNEFERIPEWASEAAVNNIEFEAVHAPSDGVNGLWDTEEEPQEYLRRLFKIIELCGDSGVSKVVMHIASGNVAPACEQSLERFKKIEDFADRANVHMCYENANGIDRLSDVLSVCGKNHGFCLDTGHNLCYAEKTDLLELYGDKMLYTHIHDNLGPSGGDMHMLPFDGKYDWKHFTEVVRSKGYKGTLNLELAARGKDSYRSCSYVEFVREAKKRADMLSKMIQK